MFFQQLGDLDFKSSKITMLQYGGDQFYTLFRQVQISLRSLSSFLLRRDDYNLQEKYNCCQYHLGEYLVGFHLCYLKLTIKYRNWQPTLLRVNWLQSRRDIRIYQKKNFFLCKAFTESWCHTEVAVCDIVCGFSSNQ